MDTEFTLNITSRDGTTLEQLTVYKYLSLFDYGDAIYRLACKRNTSKAINHSAIWFATNATFKKHTTVYCVPWSNGHLSTLINTHRFMLIDKTLFGYSPSGSPVVSAVTTFRFILCHPSTVLCWVTALWAVLWMKARHCFVSTRTQSQEVPFRSTKAHTNAHARTLTDMFSLSSHYMQCKTSEQRGGSCQRDIEHQTQQQDSDFAKRNFIWNPAKSCGKWWKLNSYFKWFDKVKPFQNYILDLTVTAGEMHRKGREQREREKAQAGLESGPLALSCWGIPNRSCF